MEHEEDDAVEFVEERGASLRRVLVVLEDITEWISTGKVDGVGFDDVTIVGMIEDEITGMGLREERV